MIVFVIWPLYTVTIIAGLEHHGYVHLATDVKHRCTLLSRARAHHERHRSDILADTVPGVAGRVSGSSK